MDIVSNRGSFIPVPEQVTISNLRKVVVALNSADTPMLYRRRFYECNPIPGVIWTGVPDNPILQNMDYIVPVIYGVDEASDDRNKLHRKLQYLVEKIPKYFTDPVNFGRTGNRSQLVCSNPGTLRVPDSFFHTAILFALIEIFEFSFADNSCQLDAERERWRFEV